MTGIEKDTQTAARLRQDELPLDPAGCGRVLHWYASQRVPIWTRDDFRDDGTHSTVPDRSDPRFAPNP